MNILLIDDDAAVLEVVALMLVSEGHAVTTAGSGRAGLATLEAGEPVDLVLTDLAMPDMSGWDVVRAVRRRWPNVRVGLVTGTPEHLAEQREDVDVLITKPVTLAELRQGLRQAERYLAPRRDPERG
jgi:CheY-like chemotaxis protein